MSKIQNDPPDQGVWEPLAPEKTERIRHLFSDLFPASEHRDLAQRIADYWITRLKHTWRNKPDVIRQKDRSYHPSDPLSRIAQKTVIIAYADSVYANDETTLTTLENFFDRYFPAAGGLHILPACRVAEDRFNDGYFSQIVRDQIHPAFGTNQQFARLSEKYFSMADFVLNHVDMDNPRFQAYLDGDDQGGNCFFVFSDAEYQKHLSDGDFDQIFRPRPFPLFTIFRRKPKNPHFAKMSAAERMAVINHCLAPGRLPDAVIGLLSIFNKIKNDQMLLEKDYAHIRRFIAHIRKMPAISADTLFTLSETQETRHPPYIFQNHIRTKADLLKSLGHDTDTAKQYAAIFEKKEQDIFGEEIRALTTFSHVQVDLNTSSFGGLQMLCDDFCWYLSMDLNMLRLDAANYAFKRWKTTCFGLPEVKLLMQILYLSMDLVAPRMVANLEVNDRLSAILAQMADPETRPPMMYDFHLASLLPVVFNSQDTTIAARIFDLIRQYRIPKTSIRFSVADSHDGKSVRGSMDLLTLSERQDLACTVEKNGGKIKTRAVPNGREPYEICTSTRDALTKLNNPQLEAERYLAFYTMAFALMGRHVKSVYFNDLMGLGNDYDRMAATGELRDIKRTRSAIESLEEKLNTPGGFHARVAAGMNQLICLVDADPALHPRASEAEMIATENSDTACIHNHRGTHHSFSIINVSDKPRSVSVHLPASMAPLSGALVDQFSQQTVKLQTGTLALDLNPYQRLWLKENRLEC